MLFAKIMVDPKKVEKIFLIIGVIPACPESFLVVYPYWLYSEGFPTRFACENDISGTTERGRIFQEAIV